MHGGGGGRGRGVALGRRVAGCGSLPRRGFYEARRGDGGARPRLADSGMSLPDYDVLTALSVAGGGRMQITVLAAQIGWERSRVSHHVRRMSARGLVTCGLSAADRRVTEVTLTARGWQAQE